MISATDSYNRTAELKSFDESKAGVKGLVDAGLSTIPRMFIHPTDPSSSPPKHVVSIPIIDLTGMTNDPVLRKVIVERIREASETWGFFQVVNHSIPIMVLEEMLEGVKRFYEQDVEVKKGYYTRDVAKKVVYNSNYDLYTGPAANWRDTFYCFMAPQPPNPQDLPNTCRLIFMSTISIFFPVCSFPWGYESKDLM